MALESLYEEITPQHLCSIVIQLIIYIQMMQWIDSVLSKGDKVEFFHDEYRCPVYVKDVVKIILALTNRWLSGNNLPSKCLYKT